MRGGEQWEERGERRESIGKVEEGRRNVLDARWVLWALISRSSR